jgi:hypothetical protein
MSEKQVEEELTTIFIKLRLKQNKQATTSTQHSSSVPKVSGTNCLLVRAFDALSFSSIAHQHAVIERLKSQQKLTKLYLNFELQEKARECIPIERLHEEARQLGGDFQDSLLKVLLPWFKKEFFTWLDAPLCEYCQVYFHFLYRTFYKRRIGNNKSYRYSKTYHVRIEMGRFTSRSV